MRVNQMLEVNPKSRAVFFAPQFPIKRGWSFRAPSKPRGGEKSALGAASAVGQPGWGDPGVLLGGKNLQLRTHLRSAEPAARGSPLQCFRPAVPTRLCYRRSL